MGLLDDIYSTELGAIRDVPRTTRANYEKLKGLLGVDSTGNGLLSDLNYGARNALSKAKWNMGNRLDNIQRFFTDPEYRNSPEVGKALREAFDQYAEAMGPGNMGGAMAGVVQKIGTAGASSTSKFGERGARRPKIEILSQEPDMRIGQRISTANPTKIAAEKIGFHSTPEYEITSEMMRENPESFKYNMDLMSAYMPTNKRSPESRYDDYLNHMTGNLKYLMASAPKDFIGRSSNWYKGANSVANDMADAYGIPVESAAAVLARLSPGMDWFQNAEQADRLADIWRNQQDSLMPLTHWDNGASVTLQKRPDLSGTRLKDMKTHSDKADWIRAFDEQTTPGYYYALTPEGAISSDYVRTQKGDPASMMWQSNDNMARAIAMLEDPSIENISRNLGLSGHKIRNFYNNIVDPFNPRDTTVDTHAVSAALGLPYSQKGIPVGHAFGGGAIPGVVGGSSKSGMASGTYGLYADAYRKAAADLGMTPQTVQSPTWELIRENFPTSGIQKDRLRQQIESGPMAGLRKGLLSPDDFRDQALQMATKGNGIKLPSWYEE